MLCAVLPEDNTAISEYADFGEAAMKILHLSDLHLGKRVNEFSMTEEQEYVLSQVLDIIDAEKPEAVFIAGDVYDKSVPSAEAVGIFDDFLYSLSQRRIQVFVISGNHDSPERIAFGGRLMDSSGIHMSPVYDGEIRPVELYDEFGRLNVYMLPFIKPVHVKRYHPDEEINSATDAMRTVVAEMNVNPECRNILITHQFVTGASLSQSEEFFVGGTDNVDAEVFDVFDYVALGHIHRPQNIRGGRIRYCGTLLKYSLSEIEQEKSVTIAEIGRKGSLEIRTVPIIPGRDMKSYKGTFEQLTDMKFYENINTDDYIFIILTDENDIPDAVGRLRKIYPKMMKLSYDNSRTRSRSVITETYEADEIPPEKLFSLFYEQQNNHSMSREQTEFVEALIKEVWEEELT